MSTQLKQRYADLVRRCFDSREEYNEENLTAFWAMKGVRAMGDLMVIGRAVNGWDDDWVKGQLSESTEIESFVTRMQERAEPKDKCPMGWVNECWQPKHDDPNYNTARSAFWRVIKGATLGIGVAKEESEWPSYLMWSNLYKVSPKDAGNPSTKLVILQQDYCAEILTLEMQRWQPKRILLLTGIDWADWFLNKLSAIRVPLDNSSHVQWAGKLEIPGGHLVPVVVGPHPQGKEEAPLVAEIIKAFSVIAEKS